MDLGHWLRMVSFSKSMQALAMFSIMIKSQCGVHMYILFLITIGRKVNPYFQLFIRVRWDTIENHRGQAVLTVLS